MTSAIRLRTRKMIGQTILRKRLTIGVMITVGQGAVGQAAIKKSLGSGGMTIVGQVVARTRLAAGGMRMIGPMTIRKKPRIGTSQIMPIGLTIRGMISRGLNLHTSLR